MSMSLLVHVNVLVDVRSLLVHVDVLVELLLAAHVYILFKDDGQKYSVSHSNIWMKFTYGITIFSYLYRLIPSKSVHVG